MSQPWRAARRKDLPLATVQISIHGRAHTRARFRRANAQKIGGALKLELIPAPGLMRVKAPGAAGG